jgi:plastocyanin
MVLCLVAASAAIIWGTAGAALAGGGCHSGATKGTDPHIEIVDACFTATITSVAPGTEVSFVNKDPFVHNVTANGWGHFDDLQPGDSFTVSFADEGIYPFACTYHPGMSGAIVVGDGNGPGNGSTVFVEENSNQPPAKRIQPVVAESSGPSWLWIVAAGLIGLGAGSVLTAGLTRTGKTQPSS